MQFEKADDSRKLAICSHKCQPPQEETLSDNDVLRRPEEWSEWSIFR